MPKRCTQDVARSVRSAVPIQAIWASFMATFRFNFMPPSSRRRRRRRLPRLPACLQCTQRAVQYPCLSALQIATRTMTDIPMGKSDFWWVFLKIKIWIFGPFWGPPGPLMGMAGSVSNCCIGCTHRELCATFLRSFHSHFHFCPGPISPSPDPMQFRSCSV